MNHTTRPEAGTWFQPITNGDNRATLLCFPYSGSGAAIFGSWKQQMFDGVELVAARLPGREGRLREAPLDNVDELVEIYVEEIANSRYCQSPLFLLGCSLGALVAFELARSLQRKGVSVGYVIVAAAQAPQLQRTTRFIHRLPDQKLLHKLQKKYAAIPQQVLANEEMRQLLMPMLRADTKMFETYAYRPGPKLECPLMALGGTDDKTVTPKSLFAWRDQATSFRQRTFPGGHYFTKESKASVLQTIERRLRPLLSN